MHFYEIAKLHSILPSSSITLWARKIDFYSACPVTPSLMSQISQECVIIKRNKMLTRGIREAIVSEKCSFFNIVQKAFDPPPFYLNICPILQGVFFKTRFWAFDIMYLFHPQISPSMPQKSLFMQISCC